MTPPAWIVLGLGYGDEGKGTLVDALTRRTGARVNVRFNGGPQAAHHVASPEGRVHCFSQIGAGSFSPGVETFLSRYCSVDPLALDLEIRALNPIRPSDCASRIRIDPDCPLVTPWHALVNRMQERARGAGAHGTCGRGLGVLLGDLAAQPQAVPRAADLWRPMRLADRLSGTRERMLALGEAIAEAHPDDPRIGAWLVDLRTPEMLDWVLDRFRRLAVPGGPRLADADWLRARARDGLIFEGAQGALLDMDQGDWPHVTPSRTTAVNALALLAEIGFAGEVVKLGVLRAYATRHGPGPFVSEVPGLAERLPEPHNRDDGAQGAMRMGWLDAVAARRAIAANGGVEGIALTCLDRVAPLPDLAVCDAYLSDDCDWGLLEPSMRRDPAGAILEVAAPAGLEARAGLTRHLCACRPRLCAIPPGGRGLIERIAVLLGQPVDCVSLGPGPADKRWRKSGTGVRPAAPGASAGLTDGCP